MKNQRFGMGATAIDASQLADILETSEVLFTLDNGMRCFVCTNETTGDFFAFQCSATGGAFIVQRSVDGESTHDHARQILSATFGE